VHRVLQIPERKEQQEHKETPDQQERKEQQDHRGLKVILELKE